MSTPHHERGDELDNTGESPLTVPSDTFSPQVPLGAESLNGGRPHRVELPPDVTTPKLEELRRLAHDQMNAELARLEGERIGYTERLYMAINQATVVGQQVAQMKVRLDAITEALPVLSERRAAERGRQDRSDDLVSRRRREEYERRVRDAQNDYFSRLTTHRALLAIAASIEDTVERLRRIAVARARRCHAHAWRRVAVYWQRLVLAHKRGAELNARLRPVGPDLPAWVTDVPDAAGPRGNAEPAEADTPPSDESDPAFAAPSQTDVPPESAGEPAASTDNSTAYAPDDATPRSAQAGDDELASLDG